MVATFEVLLAIFSRIDSAATLLTLRSTRRTTVVAPPTYEVADSLACTVSELTMSNVAEVLEMNVVDVKGSCSFVDRT